MRKAFLGAWDPRVDDIWLYSLADAQRIYDVDVHHSVRVLTHHHTSVTPNKDNLPRFTRRVHRDVSCAVHALLCEQRYDAPRELFDDRDPHYLRLLDAPAQASHLIYERLNAVAAGLVARPQDMPGTVLDFDVWKTGYIEVQRPPMYFSADRPATLELQLTPPPLLLQAFGGDLERLVYHMNKLTDEGLRALRTARTRPVMGAQKVRRIHPWDEPRTLRESGPQPRRTFRIGARGIVATRARIAAAQEVTAFTKQHTAARVARRDGDGDAIYPFGTYQARVAYGAPTAAAPAPDAIVAMPGMVREQVLAELQRGELDRDALRVGSHAWLDEVRAAWVDEVSDIVEHNEVAVPQRAATQTPHRAPEPTAATTTDDAADDDAGPKRPGPATVHRFDRRRPEHGAHAPARLVVRRDRRRGRPPGASSGHGSDPPD